LRAGSYPHASAHDDDAEARVVFVVERLSRARGATVARAPTRGATHMSTQRDAVV
jgi:hypothetical protein